MYPDENSTSIVGFQVMLNRSTPVLDALREYDGADVLIREACNNPKDNECRALVRAHVTKNIHSIIKLYQFSKDIGKERGML